MKRIWRDNGLSIVLFGLFVLFLLGQSVTGWREEVGELLEHGQAAMPFTEYLMSGSFLEVTAENWESEFLQMFSYVLLTVVLFQRGSAESKSPDEPADVDRDPRLAKKTANVPGPVRRGGFALLVYERSLGLAFGLLFIIAFTLHAIGGAANYNAEQALHGRPAISIAGYLGTSRFWFESFQNWQSEFLAIFCMVVLSIFLRQRGSPESKPVDSPHSETGA